MTIQNNIPLSVGGSPIDTMIDCIRRAAAGEFASRIDLADHSTPLGVLAATVNQLIETLSDVISALPFGISIFDSTGRCISTNESMALILGVDKTQLLTEYYQNIPYWKQCGLLETAQTVVETQIAQHQNVTTTASSGAKIYLECHLIPFGDHGLLFMAQDITEQKRSAVKLMKNERLLDSVIEQSPHPIWISDDEGTLVRINKACCDLLNIREEEVVGKYNVLKDTIVAAQGHLPLVRSVFDDGKTVNFTIVYNSALLKHLELEQTAEVVLDVTVSPLKDQTGTITNAVITHRDITDQRRAEKALKQSKLYAEKVVESANAMIVVLDDEGLVKVVNKTTLTVTGYTRDELLHRNWFDILVPRDRYPEVRDAFQRLPDNGLPEELENPILTKTGEEHIISWRNTELKDEGRPKSFICYGIDITERKQLEKQLLQSQKLEAVGQLAGGVAHDFNNMLTVILGHAEMIQSKPRTDEAVERSISEIVRAGLHSRDITRQLLAFSRREIVSPRTIDVNQSITRIVKTLSQLIGENIDLKFIPEDTLWKIRFDPTQLDQIMINLAVNARDAISKFGHLTIETANVYFDERYRGSHPALTPGPYVKIAVSDDGAGMDKETVSHVFEPFFTTKEPGRGTGLGLSMVYGIARQNGGDIHVYSETGKGTTFSIYLPRVLENEREETSRETSQPIVHSGTILLVEDDDMVRAMTTCLLDNLGYTVIVAKSSAEALAAFENEETSIDLLLTDVVMPNMNGSELNSKIQAIRPGTKVLFMSGYTENVIVRHGVLMDGVHFIQKPFSIPKLEQKLHEVLNR